VVFALAFCAIPARLSAAAVYNNLGAGNTFGGTAASATGVTYLGTTFTTTGGGALASILVPVSDTFSPLNFTLYADAGGVPGTLLETWSLAVSSSVQLVTLTSVQHPVLSAGGKYWLLLSTLGGTMQWAFNNQNVFGGYFTGNSLPALSVNAPTGPALAIQVAVADPAVTPLPPTLVLTFSGMLLTSLLLFAMRRKLRTVPVRAVDQW